MRCGAQIEDANDILWAATAPPEAVTTGAYYVGRRERPKRAPAQDDEQRARLWEVLEAQSDTRFPSA